MKRLLRFFKALIKYVRYGKRVSYRTYIMRLSICERCPHLDKDKWTCGECGCFVDKKAKMDTETCPKYRWNIQSWD
jgi:anaerobic ribonucleoside-triphosphate reductase